ncbi:hypothetical protein [Streptomyces sp. NPDC006334]|uniref:hypothetical protein n=1 Tax=Streptomyces sp. NPDC006334 TaxID=3156754 RepID=UPI0033B9168E
MIEIVAALIGGVCLLGGAVITARWTRSRSSGNQDPAPLSPGSNAQPDNGINTSRPPRSARSDGITVNGQFIETNNGTVSQNNYRDGKQ